MRLNSILKSGFIVLIMFMLSTEVALSQDIPVWNKALLKDSVTALLTKYQVLHNQINSQADSSVVWSFMHLFPNPKVQVVNDLEGPAKITKISIEEFIVKLADLFPEGLNLTLDLSRPTIDQPKYDRNNRYILRVRLNRFISGISGGKVFSSKQKIIFIIAFYYSDNAPGNFTIYGMELPPAGQGVISAVVSPANTGFNNTTLNTDARLINNRGMVVNGGLSYTYFSSIHWGYGAGIQLSQYSGSVSLDKFDSYAGFDPSLTNVLINNELWFAELPLYFSYRSNLSKRFELRADLGLSFGFRIFEEMGSSAVNHNTGLTMTNVISDAGWISQMKRFNMGLLGNIGVAYKLNNQIGILAGLGIRQGISGLNNNSRTDFLSTRYEGQYNPLWGAPGKTINQAFFINLGASIRINGKDEK